MITKATLIHYQGQITTTIHSRRTQIKPCNRDFQTTISDYSKNKNNTDNSNKHTHNINDTIK